MSDPVWNPDADPRRQQRSDVVEEFLEMCRKQDYYQKLIAGMKRLEEVSGAAKLSLDRLGEIPLVRPVSKEAPQTPTRRIAYKESLPKVSWNRRGKEMDLPE